MATLETMFADYASYHQTAGNKWCHRIGIPLIMVSLLGMLARVPLLSFERFRLDAALLLIGLVSIYYFALEWRFGLLMLAITLGMWALGSAIPMSLNVGLFIAGWVLQFLGHGVWEKRQPAFLRNLVHLLIGPLWIVNDVVRLVQPGKSAPVGDA